MILIPPFLSALNAPLSSGSWWMATASAPIVGVVDITGSVFKCTDNRDLCESESDEFYFEIQDESIRETLAELPLTLP